MTSNKYALYMLEIRALERKNDREREERHSANINNMKQLSNIVTLANNDYHHPSLNEEYEKIATKYHNKEITRKQFLEEYEMLKVAMKLIDE